jgi:hypothetical protein
LIIALLSIEQCFGELPEELSVLVKRYDVEMARKFRDPNDPMMRAALRYARKRRRLRANPIASQTPTKYILLQIGQSNAEGYETQGAGFVDYPTGILAINNLNNTFIQATSPLRNPDEAVYINGLSFVLEFSKRLNVTVPAENIRILPCAVGGTGFQDGAGRWNVSTGDLYANMIAQVNAALAEPGWEDAVVIPMWIQGEIDSALVGGTMTVSEYEAALNALILGLRTETSRPTMPFFAGAMAANFYGQNPATAIRDFVRFETGVHYVQYSGLKTAPDGTHFIDGSSALIGGYFYDVAVAQGIVPGTARTPITVDASWASFQTSGAEQLVWTFTPAWVGSSARSIIVVAEKKSQLITSITVNGVEAEFIGGRTYSNTDGLNAYLTDQSSGDIVITYPAAADTKQVHCHVFEVSGTDVLLSHPTVVGISGGPKFDLEGDSTLSVGFSTGGAPDYGWATDTNQLSTPPLRVQVGINEPAGLVPAAGVNGNRTLFFQVFGMLDVT